MSEFEKVILYGMECAKIGHLIQDNIPSDNLSRSAYMEAFESYQDADSVFQEKCDELVYHDGKINDFSEGSPNKQFSMINVAREAAHQLLKDRINQREITANEALMKLQQELHGLQALEHNLRVKEGIMRAASARMLASMSITREKEAFIHNLELENSNYDLNPTTIEYKVARQMQQIAQKQTIISVKDFVQALEEYENAQEAIIPFDMQSKAAHILAFATKYVADNAVFVQKNPG